ncbi:MAG: sensor histidine kinase [Gammaproteobacteria bacterium]|nr:MAG: sensor histidine kinase [Gammaproteobacteria bacterium]
MDKPVADLRMLYREALADFLARVDESGLQRAYELGCEAVAAGTGLLELVALHREEADDLLNARRGASMSTLHGRSLHFLSESLAPFALLHLQGMQANAALRQMHELMEQETGRIAQALHDQAASALSMIYLDVAEVAREASSVSLGVRLGRIVKELDRLRQHLRHFSHELRPPLLDQYGLVPAMRSLADGFARRAGLMITLAGDAEVSVPDPMATVAYRVMHEALTNVVRHARARTVELNVRVRGKHLRCTVRDDGIGFDRTRRRTNISAGLGLIGMRERVNAINGSLRISSAPGRGTVVRVALPRLLPSAQVQHG